MSTKKNTALGKTIHDCLPLINTNYLPPKTPEHKNLPTASSYSSSSSTSTIYMSPPSKTILEKQHKNLKTQNQHKHACHNPKIPFHISIDKLSLSQSYPTKPINNQSPISITTTTSPSPLTQDGRRWINLGGNILQRIRDLPQTPRWSPNTSLTMERASDPFGQLLQELDLNIIPTFCHGPSTTVLRLCRKTDIHITTNDMRDIISHNSPIYHESLVLGLELLCATYNSSYVDPSFIPILKTQGWSKVEKRFSETELRHRIDHPFYGYPSIAIPVHVGGSHWVALCRRIINGITYFLYADDLNNHTTEYNLRRLIKNCTCPNFCPSNSQWINCSTPNFQPHSNECGPRTMLALAVMVTHPAPHHKILQPYISTNLAQNSRYWMSLTLLTGMIILLPPSPIDNVDQLPNIIESSPHTLIQWDTDLDSQTPTPKISHKEIPLPTDTLTSAQSQKGHIHQMVLPKIIGAQKVLNDTARQQPQKQRKTIRPPTQLTLFDTGAFEPPTDLVTPDFGAINHKT